MIHVVAVLTAKPGKRDAVLKEFRANVPNVKAENGCIEYGADAIVVIEKWASVEALKAHAVAPHMKEYGAKVKDLLANRAVYVLSPT